MGNMFQIKLKNKIKVDFKPQAAPQSTFSQTSFISESKFDYDLKDKDSNEKGVQDEDEDDDESTDSETESYFIEKELMKLSDYESESESESESDGDLETIDANQMEAGLLSEIKNLNQNPDQSKTEHPVKRKKGKNKKKSENVDKNATSASTSKLAQVTTTPFRGQDINEIRKKGVPFVDDVFKANVMALTNNPQSDFGKQMIQGMRCANDLRALNSKLVWKRPQVNILFFSIK